MNMSRLMTMARLVCDCSDRFLNDIKRRAELKGMTMKSYIINALINEIRRENESDNIHHNDAPGMHNKRI